MMGMLMDPSKAVASIIRKRKGGTSPQEKHLPLKNTDGELDPRHMAAEDILSAIHSQSTSHLMEALANFHDLHKMHGEHPMTEQSEESSMAEE